MFQPLAVCIGLRYIRAGKHLRRRNPFVSFIASASMLGVAVGVMALIVILSVMNGFEQELRGRILGMTAHAFVESAAAGPLRDWRALLPALERQRGVVGVAPFVSAEAMAVHHGYVNGMTVRGVRPEAEPQVSFIGDRLLDGRLADLVPGGFGVILGRGLARSLHAEIGDRVTVISPQPNVTAAGIIPRSRRFTVVGVLEVGMHEYDTALALVHIDDAARLFRLGDGVSGLRLKLDDVFAAPAIGREIAAGLPADLRVVDWTQQHVTFFQALKTEKAMMAVILLLIVAVAAFNIVSTLVMVVTEKQADIAILRTMGISPRAVMAIFVVQGAINGVAGTLLGGAAGVWLAGRVPAITGFIERQLGFQFLPADIYYISELPSELHWFDVSAIVAM